MRGLASLLTVTRAEWGTGRSPRERGQQVPPLPGNGMWTRPQRRSGWPSPHIVSRALVCGIPGWCLGGRAQAGPWPSVLPAQPLALLSVFIGRPIRLGSWSLPVSSPRWRTKVTAVRVLLRWDPGPISVGSSLYPPVAALFLCLGLGSLRSISLSPPPYFSSSPNNICAPQELPGLWGWPSLHMLALDLGMVLRPWPVCGVDGCAAGLEPRTVRRRHIVGLIHPQAHSPCSVLTDTCRGRRDCLPWAKEGAE